MLKKDHYVVWLEKDGIIHFLKDDKFHGNWFTQDLGQAASVELPGFARLTAVENPKWTSCKIDDLPPLDSSFVLGQTAEVLAVYPLDGHLRNDIVKQSAETLVSDGMTNALYTGQTGANSSRIAYWRHEGERLSIDSKGNMC